MRIVRVRIVPESRKAQRAHCIDISRMSDRLPNRADVHYAILNRLRSARRDFHAALTNIEGSRERLFAPVHLWHKLREHVGECALGGIEERCDKLFVLTVLLYGALDWHFAGQGIDVEADVQLERIRQNHRYGGPQIDAKLSPDEWRTRLQQQLLRLEQQLACEEVYADRLVKLTALAQAALEATYRQTSPDVEAC